MTVFDDPGLECAVAKFLFIASKEEPDNIAGLYRAAALALLGKPIDANLLREAGKRKTIDDGLYTKEISDSPMLEDIWQKYIENELKAASL